MGRFVKSVQMFSFMCALAFMLNDAFAMSVTQVSCSTAGDCTSYANTYCGGGAPGCAPSGSTGLAMFRGTNYPGKCYCLACGGGTTLPPVTSVGPTTMVCVWDKNQCKTNSTTNNTTHVVTTSLTSTYATGIYKDMSAATPQVLPLVCVAQNLSHIRAPVAMDMFMRHHHRHRQHIVLNVIPKLFRQIVARRGPRTPIRHNITICWLEHITKHIMQTVGRGRLGHRRRLRHQTVGQVVLAVAGMYHDWY